jgi:SAM-dependent methyltransferase
MTVFGKVYAKYYDRIYTNKDYESECKFLNEIFEGRENIQTVLDIGCGTGRHAELLADMGYEVYGVDKSEHMVEIARERGVEAYTTIGDLPIENFDACISMFNTVGYIGASRLEFVRLLDWLSHHVGLFVFDFWNGVAVSKYGLGKTRQDLGDGIVRTVKPESCRDNVVTLSIRLVHYSGLTEIKGNLLCYEKHRVRFFYVDELVALLGRPISFYKAYEIDVPKEDDFVMVCVKSYRLNGER